MPSFVYKLLSATRLAAHCFENAFSFDLQEKETDIQTL